MHKIVSLLLLRSWAAVCTCKASNFNPPNAPGTHGVGLLVVQQYDHGRVFRQKSI